ncbi:MAG: hypothetical protein LBK60_02430 [Verrucomicrobiales bacterium]|jgi:hypothetical protein|nr:hypothetical protein [Verrucomicrobiales bacterium]
MIKSNKRTLVAGVSIDRSLYREVLAKRIVGRDTNFSRYIRDLIRRDCGLKAEAANEHGK